MGYTFETSYYFRPYRGNSNYWLNRSGSGNISDHQGANLYTATGDPDQRLQVHQVSGGCQLLSDLDHSYGLNIYGRGAGSVCDFYPVSGNESDALIDLLTIDATNNLYRVKMINHNLYLTPASNTKSAKLTWENASNADNQIWQLCTTQSGGGTGEKTLELPVFLSQKSHSSQWFRDAGCAVTAGIMAAAYHDKTIYNIHSFDGQAPSGNQYWTERDGYFMWETPNGWCFVEDGNVTSYPSDAETVAYIKSIIDRGIPPICYCPTGKGHWMLAYSYTSGSTFDNILIADPADGTKKTLKEGIIYSCGYGGLSTGITRIRKAPNAH